MLTIDLAGRVVLLLGGSRGIGEGITRLLCQAGAQVVFTHTGNPEYAGRLEARCGKSAPRAVRSRP